MSTILEIAPVFMSVTAALRRTGYSRGTLYRLMREGEIASFQEGRMRKLVAASVDEHIRKRLEQAMAPYRPYSGKGGKSQLSSAGDTQPIDRAGDTVTS